jgi:hypothetical protein
VRAVIVVLLLAGCAHDPYVAAYQTVTGARLATTAAVVGVGQYDHPHQMALADQAKATCHAQPQADAAGLISCQQAEGGKLLDQWDATYKKIKIGRDALATTFDTAEIGIAAAQAAQAGNLALIPLLVPVKQALRDLATTLNDAGVPPGYAAALISIAGGAQ